jgi:hypothetical protein
MTTTKRLWFCAALGLAWQPACGSDSNAGAAGSAGSVSGEGGSSGAGGAAGAAGAASIPDLITMLTTPMCDATAQSETSCGGTTCPALPDNASMTCTINCCVADGQCGTRVADTRIQQLLGSTCLAPVVTDSRCPSTTILGMTLVGCCDSQGVCGQVLGPLCLATGGRACDDDAGTADAGM